MLDEQRPRRVVPRWRSSWLTARTAEATTGTPPTQPDLSGELARKQLELELDPTIPVASEVMFLARQAGNVEVARAAANLIVTQASRIGNTQLVVTAQRVMHGGAEPPTPPTGQEFVHKARRLLELDYRNPVLLMDIARELTIMGEDDAALRYVRTAIGQAPDSRFVIRAAARYFLHVGNHEEAHNVLRRSPLLRIDPWVQASEVAVATVRGKTSQLAKLAIQRISNAAVVDIHLTELASAVATIELAAGADKKAKRLFQKALANPNDNSLAQAEWAATRLKLVVDEAALRVPFSFEANSNHAYRRLDIDHAITCAREWSSDEPFASRPLNTLQYFYCLQGDYEAAQRAIKSAIEADGSDNFQLQLNALFTTIQAGDVDRAHEEILRLARRPEAKGHAEHLLANAGALAYSTGDHEVGRRYYESAIRVARAKASGSAEALARAFYARAATLSGDSAADSIVKEAAGSVEKLSSPGAIYVVRGLVDVNRRKQLEDTAVRRVAKRRWEWDSAANTLTALE